MIRLVLCAAALLQATPQEPQPIVPRNGRFRGEIVDPVKKDVIMKVRMAIPEKRPADKTWGFIFVCHGFKGHENNSYLDGTVAALKRLGIDDQYLVVAGKSKNDGWTEEDDERFLRLYAWAKDTYPLDPKRLYLFGSSNGARFVNRFGSLHQDIVAGVVSYCGSYDLSKMVEPAEKKTEWYYVHGGKDNPGQSRKMCDELKKRSYRYVFRLLDGYGHTDIWDGKDHPDKSLVDAVCDDWAGWLHTLPHAAPAEGEKDLKALETAARWRLGGAQDALCARAKLKEADAVQALGRAARLMLAGNFEDKPVIQTLVDLSDDADAKVREAAVAALTKGVAAPPENWKAWAAEKLK
jgi:dienelactone hydrolase